MVFKSLSMQEIQVICWPSTYNVALASIAANEQYPSFNGI